MKTTLVLITFMLLAACASSPAGNRAPSHVTFTGEYLDARTSPAAVTVKRIYRESVPVPLALRKNQIDADASVAFIVEKDGTTSQAQIVKATDYEFGEAARQSVLHWRYAPPKKDGQPVRVALEEPFTLRFDP
jgi:TonB family protein